MTRNSLELAKKQVDELTSCMFYKFFIKNIEANSSFFTKNINFALMYKIHFAPLQGYTEDIYRRLHNKFFGCVDTYTTPFVRLEHGGMRSKDMRDIRPEFNEGVNVVPQVIANGGKELHTLIETIKPMGYSRLDINMGCPFPLQTRHGRGAGILINKDKVEEIAEVVKEQKDIVFSVKMRLGYDSPTQWQDCIDIINGMPLCHVTMHPRIATQQYKGDVNMDMFDDFLSACSHPVIYNGDIATITDIKRLEERYGDKIAGVMIGRGLLARPSLAMEYAEGKEITQRQLIEKIKQMHDDLHAHYAKIIPGEAQLHSKLRTYWDFMEPTIGRKPWKSIVKAGNMRNYLAEVVRL